MPERSQNLATDFDLRSFRLQLTPRRSLGHVARGAEVHRSVLSRIETGQRAITVGCARRLARFYSSVTGRQVSAGEILDMADRSAHGRPRPAIPGRATNDPSGAMEVSELVAKECAE